MPTSTYTPLANLTLSSSAASVTFSSISQAYRDLVLVATGNASPAQSIRMQFNGNQTANAYSFVKMIGTGSAANSTSGTAAYGDASGQDGWHATNRSQLLMQIFDYTATDKHKSFLVRNDQAVTSAVGAITGRWANTAAISDVMLYPTAGSTFSTGSTFALYGIAA